MSDRRFTHTRAPFRESPVIAEKSRELVRAELADLIDDAERALTSVAAPTPQTDNALYYQLPFLVRALRPGGEPA